MDCSSTSAPVSLSTPSLSDTLTSASTCLPYSSSSTSSPSTSPSSSSALASYEDNLPFEYEAPPSQLLEINSTDVIRVILQFLHENKLSRTLSVLQEEANCSLQSVPDLTTFTSRILNGKWDNVFNQIHLFKLPTTTLIMLYTQVTYELLELREVSLARKILNETSAMQLLKAENPSLYKSIQNMCNRGTLDPQEAYEGTTREARRSTIASIVTKEITESPSGRLLALIHMAIKWQQHQGLLPPGVKFDLFRGMAATAETAQELCPQRLSKPIKLGLKSHAECAVFSPDGQYLVTGSVDGFVEVWDWTTASLHNGFEYQNKDDPMLHSTAVLAICFSKDSEVIASASQDGQIKIWRLATGECKKKIDKAHDGAITTIQFNKECTHLLTGSFDTTVRIHSVKLGATVKLFRGHKSYVNSAIFTVDGTHVVSCSSDGKVRVWDAKSCECRRIFSPPPPPFLNSTMTSAINKIVLSTSSKSHSKGSANIYEDTIYICNRCPTLYLMNLGGHVVKTLASGKRTNGDFVDVAVSPRGDWLYGIAEDNTVYCFSNITNKLEHVLKVHDKDVLGICHHPHHSVLVTWGLDGLLNIIKP